jgi:hypothetical protein
MSRIFFRLLTCLALSLFVLSLTAEAQDKKRTVGKAAGPKVVATKPGVYITFERFGKRMPLRDDENGEGVWLRLNNNMKYSIRVCGFGVTEEGEQLLMYGKNATMSLYYDVVMNARSITDNRPLPVVPLGYPLLTCHEFELEAGKSIVFAVPKEHLAEELSIKIGFSYGWEETGENNPTHFVDFNSYKLPKKPTQ